MNLYSWDARIPRRGHRDTRARGKVLVLDVALTPEAIVLATVHTSYARSAEGHDSPALDAFFSRLVSGVSKGWDRSRLRDTLGYAMGLDEFAAHEGNGEARRFSEVNAFAKEKGDGEI